MFGEHVLEHARSRATGMLRLGDLSELERIAQQNQVSCGVRRRQRISERELTGLINDEIVDRIRPHPWSRPQPRRPADQVVGVGLRTGPRLLDTSLPQARRPWVCVATSGLEETQFSLRREDLVGREEEIVYHRMAHRGDADAFSGLDEFVDDVRTAVRLAGAWRALDGDIALVEVANPLERSRRGRQ